MTANSFLDSNIVVYAFDIRDSIKRKIALNLLLTNPFISSQVIVESHNASIKKLKVPSQICDDNVIVLCNTCQVVSLNETIVRSAISLKNKYSFSFLDSMIIATALAANCTTLYSEDMQHNQIIENTLTIINPFI